MIINAQVATYPPNVKYVDLFIEAEKSARENKKGLWEDCKWEFQICYQLKNCTN